MGEGGACAGSNTRSGPAAAASLPLTSWIATFFVSSKPALCEEQQQQSDSVKEEKGGGRTKENE